MSESVELMAERPIEIECPECKARSQFIFRKQKKALSGCHACKADLIISYELHTKRANWIALELKIKAVPAEVEQKSKRELRVV